MSPGRSRKPRTRQRRGRPLRRFVIVGGMRARGPWRLRWCSRSDGLDDPADQPKQPQEYEHPAEHDGQHRRLRSCHPVRLLPRRDALSIEDHRPAEDEKHGAQDEPEDVHTKKSRTKTTPRMKCGIARTSTVGCPKDERQRGVPATPAAISARKMRLSQHGLRQLPGEGDGRDTANDANPPSPRALLS